MSMANSIENRSPLLDYKLFEFMSSIPKKIRNKNGLKSFYKSILSEDLPDFVTKAKKSGPNLPLKFWLNERPEQKNKIILFIKKIHQFLKNLYLKSLLIILKMKIFLNLIIILKSLLNLCA